MNILVHELNECNVQDVNQCDGTFTIDSKLIINAESGEICYTIESVTPFEKRYRYDNIDYTTYIANPDKTIFFAYLDRKSSDKSYSARTGTSTPISKT